MRSPNPGETQHRQGLQDEKQNLNRVHIAQIVSIKPEHGIASVVVNGTGQKYNVVIPTYGLSTRGFNSSWWRYMPQTKDYVKLGFGSDGRPEIISMATWGDRFPSTATDAPNFGPHIAGYSQIQDLANRSRGGLSAFTQLKEGEWDFRSSGDAYIHGSNQGRLLLAGGATRIELRKKQNEAELKTGLTILTDGEGTSIRLGDIKRRLLPTDFQDTTIPASTKELDITVTTGGLLPLSMYQSRFGDVRDALGLPETLDLVPLRARQTCYDSTGLLTTFEVKTDINGNVDARHGVLATTGLTIVGPISALNTDYLNTTINSSVRTVVNGDANAVLSGEIVQLGSGAALHPVTRADLLVAATVPYTVAETVAWTTLAALNTALAAWLVTDNSVTKGALQAAVAAAIPLMTAAALATGTYAGTSATWPSPAVLTD